MGATATVLLGHRSPLIEAALGSLIERSGLTLSGMTGDIHELQRLAQQTDPDVILFDWRLPDGGIEAVRTLAKVAPRSAIAVLVDPDSLDDIFRAMEAGVSGYLSERLEPEIFLDSLRLIARGDVIVSKEMAGRITQAYAAQQDRESRPQLTEREVEVLGLVAAGATNREIAEKLTVAENTVKVHLRNILEKLNLRNRQQAAVYAAREGIYPEETRAKAVQPSP